MNLTIYDNKKHTSSITQEGFCEELFYLIFWHLKTSHFLNISRYRIKILPSLQKIIITEHRTGGVEDFKKWDKFFSTNPDSTSFFDLPNLNFYDSIYKKVHFETITNGIYYQKVYTKDIHNDWKTQVDEHSYFPISSEFYQKKPPYHLDKKYQFFGVKPEIFNNFQKTFVSVLNKYYWRFLSRNPYLFIEISTGESNFKEFSLVDTQIYYLNSFSETQFLKEISNNLIADEICVGFYNEELPFYINNGIGIIFDDKVIKYYKPIEIKQFLPKDINIFGYIAFSNRNNQIKLEIVKNSKKCKTIEKYLFKFLCEQLNLFLSQYSERNKMNFEFKGDLDTTYNEIQLETIEEEEKEEDLIQNFLNFDSEEIDLIKDDEKEEFFKILKEREEIISEQLIKWDPFVLSSNKYEQFLHLIKLVKNWDVIQIEELNYLVNCKTGNFYEIIRKFIQLKHVFHLKRNYWAFLSLSSDESLITKRFKSVEIEYLEFIEKCGIIRKRELLYPMRNRNVGFSHSFNYSMVDFLVENQKIIEKTIGSSKFYVFPGKEQYFDAIHYEYMQKMLVSQKENNSAGKRRERILRSKTKEFAKDIPHSLYEKIVEFINKNEDILKGRSIEDVYITILHIFLENHFTSYNFKESIPFKLINIYFRISIKFSLKYEIIKKFLPTFDNKNGYRPLNGILLFTLKDIRFMKSITHEENCLKIFNLLLKFNSKLPIEVNKEYNIAAIFYIIKKEFGMRGTQDKIAEFFDTTSVTLRKRIKYLQKNKHLKEEIVNKFYFLKDISIF